MALLISSQDDLSAKMGEHAMRLAEEVIEDCRVQLMLKFRFLDLALWQMPLEPVWGSSTHSIGTDAINVYCEPFGELSRYIDTPEEAVRDYLHLVMHCIYRHPFDSSHPQTDIWWIACDVMTESSCMDICGSRFESPDDPRRRQIVSQLQGELGNITPGKLYKLFSEAVETPIQVGEMLLDEPMLAEIGNLFLRDVHDPWPGNPQKNAGMERGNPEPVGKPDPGAQEDGEHGLKDAIYDPEGEGGMDSTDDSEGGSEKDAENEESEEGQQSKDSDSEETKSDAKNSGEGADAEGRANARWRQIAKQVETDLETFSKEWGDSKGTLVTSLKLANRDKVDYTDFLQRFAIVTEDIKTNPDEFDLVFYTYGLHLYGDLPLIEPLEYMENKRIRDFVIAIDTSGSVRGHLVRKFVEHTFGVLKSSESFGSNVNIHIIQCDSEIQSDAKIGSLEDLDAYLDDFSVKGFGGTDFRPVFERVEELIDAGELEDMRGMIYFTDGLGQYPDAPPDYDVAFVIVDDDEPEIPAVPPWAMRVLIDEEGIEDL